jgi:uncharacterized protein
MTVTEFTPWVSLFGGILIGLAATLLMALEGRIAGVSGIVSKLLPPYRDRLFLPRLAFVTGLVATPILYQFISGTPIVQTVSSNLGLMALAGLLVGVGTVIGNGCTSGHGVCGLARLSKRSLVATLVFCAVAMLTVYIVRHAMP